MIVVKSGLTSTEGLAIDCRCMCWPFGNGQEHFDATVAGDWYDACACLCPDQLIQFIADSASATP